MASRIKYLASIAGLTTLSFSLFAQEAANTLAIENADWSISEGQRLECPDCLSGYNLIVEAVSSTRNSQYSLEISGHLGSISDIALYDSILSVTGPLPFGGESVTVFDLVDGSKVTEFYGYYVTRSPDGRYFIYKQYYPRFGMRGHFSVVMLFDVLESREPDKTFLVKPLPQDVGIPIYPPQQRIISDRGSIYKGMDYHDLSHVVFDMPSHRAIFPVDDEFNNLSIASISLWQEQFVSEMELCVVPLIGATLTSNYLTKESRHVVEKIEVLESSSLVDVSLFSTRGVSTNFRLNLKPACWYSRTQPPANR